MQTTGSSLADPELCVRVILVNLFGMKRQMIIEQETAPTTKMEYQRARTIG